jgi:hypothetical protein
MSVVFPGQDLNSLIEEGLNMSHKTEPIKIHIGSGIIQNGNELISVRPGRLLNPNQSTKFSLLSLQKRYVPLQNDLVIGIVTARLSELFRVDIGAQTLAVLPVLSGFDSSTKKNRPTWPVNWPVLILLVKLQLIYSENLEFHAQKTLFPLHLRVSIKRNLPFYYEQRVISHVFYKIRRLHRYLWLLDAISHLKLLQDLMGAYLLNLEMQEKPLHLLELLKPTQMSENPSLLRKLKLK